MASPKINKRRRTGNSGMVQQQEQQQEQEEEEDFEALWESLTGVSPEEEKV